MSAGIFKEFRPEDVDISPFVAHKRWTVSNEEGISSAADISISGSYYTGSSVYLGTFSTASKGLNGFVSESSTEPAYNGKYEFIVHSNIDKMFYRYAQNGIQNEQQAIAFQSHYPDIEHRDLHRRVAVVSIPQQIWGEGIKRGSIMIKDRSGATDINIKDDSYTNLYDESIDTTNMIDDSKLLLHVPFSEGFRYTKFNSNSIGHYQKEKPGLHYNSAYPHRVVVRNGKFEKGMHGYGMTLDGTSGSYVITKRLGDIDPSTDFGRAQEFAMSMWLKIPTSQSVFSSMWGNYENVPTFQTGYRVAHRKPKAHNQNTIVSNRKSPWNTAPFPFHIEVGNSKGSDKGKVILKRGNGVTVKTLKTPSAYNDNTWRHWVFQKTGSNLEIYVDGQRVATTTDFPKGQGKKLKGTTVSQNPLTFGGIRYNNWKYGVDATIAQPFLGAFALPGQQVGSSPGSQPTQPITPAWKWSYYQPTAINTNTDRYKFNTGIEPMLFPFTGSIDEFRLYYQAIPSASIIALSESVNNTNIIGNIFYDYGLLTVTDPRPKYSNVFQGTGANNWYVSFQNNWTIYEQEYICHIKSHDFDVSMNPTLREDNIISDDRLKGITTHSAFSPYITTVGLYDDNYDLLATAKLGQPLKKPKNMDTTIVVRFDK